MLIYRKSISRSVQFLVPRSLIRIDIIWQGEMSFMDGLDTLVVVLNHGAILDRENLPVFA